MGTHYLAFETSGMFSSEAFLVKLKGEEENIDKVLKESVRLGSRVEAIKENLKEHDEVEVEILVG